VAVAGARDGVAVGGAWQAAKMMRTMAASMPSDRWRTTR
jgi:hypothetical protein